MNDAKTRPAVSRSQEVTELLMGWTDVGGARGNGKYSIQMMTSSFPLFKQTIHSE